MHVDFAIIGAGMAGAALAYRLASDASVALIEKKTQVLADRHAWAYHSDGSAIQQALTQLSQPFLQHHHLMQERPVLYTGAAGQQALLACFQSRLRQSGQAICYRWPAQIKDDFPFLHHTHLAGALYTPSLARVDVQQLHRFFLTRATAGHFTGMSGHTLTAAQWGPEGWNLFFDNGRQIRAKVLINAAGGQADAIARLVGGEPVGLRQHDRHHFLFQVGHQAEPEVWPDLIGIDGSYACHPAGEQVWLSASEDVAPQFAQEHRQPLRAQMDLAYAVYQLESVANIRLHCPLEIWQQSVCYAPDQHYVAGWDAQIPRFFWLSGLGQASEQVLPALSQWAACVLLGQALPAPLQQLDWQLFNPRRAMSSEHAET